MSSREMAIRSDYSRPFDGTVLFELRFWLRRLRTHLVSTRSDFEKTLTDRFPKT